MASYRKGLTLSLGSVISTQVDLYSVTPSKSDTGLHRICPDHHVQLKQTHVCFYVENDETKEHQVSNFVLGYEQGDGWIVPDGEKPSKEAVEALELSPIPPKEVFDNTFEGSGFYYCMPSAPHSLQTWSVLNSIASKGKVALVARGNLKKAVGEKLWKLGSFRGVLALREIVFPENIKEIPKTTVPWEGATVEKNITTLVNQFVANLETSWANLDTTDDSKQLIRQWIEKGQNIGAPETAQVKTNPTALFDALQESLRQAKK